MELGRGVKRERNDRQIFVKESAKGGLICYLLCQARAYSWNLIQSTFSSSNINSSFTAGSDTARSCYSAENNKHGVCDPVVAALLRHSKAVIFLPWLNDNMIKCRKSPLNEMPVNAPHCTKDLKPFYQKACVWLIFSLSSHLRLQSQGFENNRFTR